jgi:hypothetical protein
MIFIIFIVLNFEMDMVIYFYQGQNWVDTFYSAYNERHIYDVIEYKLNSASSYVKIIRGFI